MLFQSPRVNELTRTPSYFLGYLVPPSALHHPHDTLYSTAAKAIIGPQIVNHLENGFP